MKAWIPFALLLCSILMFLLGAPGDKHIAFFALLWGFLLLYHLTELRAAEALRDHGNARSSRLAAMILKHLDHENIRKEYAPGLRLINGALVLWVIGGCLSLGWVFYVSGMLSSVIAAALPAVVLLCFLLQAGDLRVSDILLRLCGALFAACWAANLLWLPGPGLQAPPESMIAAVFLSLYPFYFILRRAVKNRSAPDLGLAILVIAGCAGAPFLAISGPQALSVWCAGAAVTGLLWARAGHASQRRYRIFMP